MEFFSESHANLMLGVEWLVKVDPEQSKPYLFKFASEDNGLCCIMVTDTIQLWAEVLTPQQFSRRWTACNLNAPIQPFDDSAVRSERLRLLAAAHTFSGMDEIRFEFAESSSCDGCFKLECDTSAPATSWSWRWETFSVGPKISAQILSQHLITPLITTMHLAFQSADPVSELADNDLEQGVDKMTRTARRSLDTHIRHAMSKPRSATTIRRITAMLNQVPKTLPILSDLEDVNLDPILFGPQNQGFNIRTGATAGTVPAGSRDRHSPEEVEIMRRHLSPPPSTKEEAASLGLVEDLPLSEPKPRGKLVRRAVSPANEPERPKPSPPRPQAEEKSSEDDKDVEMKIPSGSETEDSDDEVALTAPSKHTSAVPATSGGESSRKGSSLAANIRSESESSPVKPPPAKKPKAASSSSDEDDSEAERKRYVARMAAGSKRGGARQPIKRGGKRF